MSNRIALISGGLPLGGSSTFLLNLAGELVRRRNPVIVGSLEGGGPYAEEFGQCGIPLHVEDDQTRIFEDRISGMLSRLRDFQPNVVVACLGPSSFEILRYIPSGVLRLGMIQSDFPENYSPFAPYVPYLNSMVGVSAEIVRNLRKHPDFDRVSSYCVPYGVAVPEESPLPRWPQSGNPVKILYLGRLEQPQKRVRLFPHILKQLSESGLPFEWTIAGDGPERNWLHANLPSQSGNVHVRLTGPASYRDVPKILAAHDVFLLPSVAEGLPLSLLEAMAYGVVPVVSHLPSGISEVADQNSAMLVHPDRIDGYAEAVVWLALHPEEAVAKSKQAVQSVRRSYSVAAMTDRWLAMLEQFNLTRIKAEWPDHFRVNAPLGGHGLRFSRPLRMVRRWWRRRLSQVEQQRSTPK